jgi:uncharacterized protein YggE
MHVARIRSIAEGGDAPAPRPMVMMRAVADSAPSTPILAGDVSQSVAVTVVFELN